MAIIKNAMLRYRVLDRCFRNTGRNYTLNTLLVEVNKELREYNGPESEIKRRQLEYDIQFMESDQGWSVPLIRSRDGNKMYLRYDNPTFSISNEPLNQQEVHIMASAMEVLSRFSGAPQFEEIQEILPMLRDRFGLKNSDSKEVIQVESNIDLKGLEHLNTIYEAILKHQVLNVTYQDFISKEPYILTFHPYFLKQFNNRWFALGRHSINQVDTWNLALDRIVEIELTSEAYHPTDIDWNEYFYDIIGVTIYEDKPLERIVLSFDESTAPYVETKPLHATQKLLEKGEELLIEIHVRPNHELKALLLSFGAGVTVIKPKWLANELNTIVKSMMQKYSL